MANEHPNPPHSREELLDEIRLAYQVMPERKAALFAEQLEDAYLECAPGAAERRRLDEKEGDGG